MHISQRLRITGLALLSVLMTLCPALVQAVQRGNIDATLDAVREAERLDFGTHLGRGPLDRGLEGFSRARDRLDNEYGLYFDIQYSPIFHRGTQGGSGNKTFNDGLDLYLRWDGAVALEGYRGSLDIFAFRRKDDYLSTNTQEFMDALGSTIAPNDANVSGTHNSLANLTWESLLFDGALDITVGQFFMPGSFDGNEILGNDRLSFIAEPLSNNPSRVIPDSEVGMGVGTWIMPTDSFYLGVMAVQADANGKDPDFDRFNGDWVYTTEVAWTPNLESWGQGNYRLSYSEIDATGKGDGAQLKSNGFNISIDQQVGEKMAFAFRYGDNDGKRKDIERLVSAGLLFKQVLGYQLDEIGLGAFWTKPGDDELRNEYGAEAFWRLQLTRRTQLTPDIQLWRPSNDKKSDLEAVFSLRLTINI